MQEKNEKFFQFVISTVAKRNGDLSLRKHSPQVNKSLTK